MTCSIKSPSPLSLKKKKCNGNQKIFTSPNRIENVRMQDDSTNIAFQNKRTDNPSFISNPVLILHGSVRIRNQNNKHNNLHFIKVEDNLSVQPKNIYKITSLNKDCLLELHHMQVQRNLTMKSMYNRRQSFKTNNKRQSKKELR